MSKKLTSYKRTSVNFLKSQQYISKLLLKHGIEDLQFTQTRKKIGFKFLYPQDNIKLGVLITLNLPEISDKKKQEQIINQYWRALYYYLKSKLEAVEFGIREFIEEFFADLIIKQLLGGQDLTVRDQIIPQLDKAIKENRQPDIKLLTE